MKHLAILLGCFLALVSPVATSQAQKEIDVVPATGDPRVYGEYPMAYREIIERWIGSKLGDPQSAVIDWGDAPKPGEYKTQKNERFVGYVVDFKVNARNQFGTYTGKQRYRVVIRNGEVVWGGRPRY